MSSIQPVNTMRDMFFIQHNVCHTLATIFNSLASLVFHYMYCVGKHPIQSKPNPSFLGVYACTDDKRVTSVDRLAWPPTSKGPTSQPSLSDQLVGTLCTIFTPFSTLLILPTPFQPPSITSDWLLLYKQSKSVKWDLLYLPPIKHTYLHLCLPSRFLSDYNRGEWF